MDIVFVVDTTGSMGSSITNVKNNISGFVDALTDANIKPYFALVEYRDITCDGKYSTNAKINKDNNSCWFSTAESFKSEIAALKVDGGGDAPETAIDGIEFARRLNLRNSSQKFFILVTDAGYKTDNNYGIKNMDEMVSLLVNGKINTSVVTSSYYRNEYSTLYTTTGGIFADIRGNFKEELLGIADKIIENTNDGCWIALQGLTLQIVKLEGIPSRTSNVDTDGDGLFDGKPVKDDKENTIIPRDDAPKTANGYADIWRLYGAEHRISGVIQREYNYDNKGLKLTMKQKKANAIVDMLLKGRDDLTGTGKKIKREILEFKKIIEGDTVLGAYLLNFIYDTVGMAYHSQPDTWQRAFGYNDFYDEVFEIGSYMNKGKFEFEYNGVTHAIWMWKGDYWNLQSGAEIGVYKYNRGVSGITQYDAIDYELPMKLSLFNYYKDTGKKECLSNWEPREDQWWITGFNPRFKDARPEYMVSIGRIDFSGRKGMYYAIKKDINNDANYGRDISRRNLITDDENYTIWICFDKGV